MYTTPGISANMNSDMKLFLIFFTDMSPQLVERVFGFGLPVKTGSPMGIDSQDLTQDLEKNRKCTEVGIMQWVHGHDGQ